MAQLTHELTHWCFTFGHFYCFEDQSCWIMQQINFPVSLISSSLHGKEQRLKVQHCEKSVVNSYLREDLTADASLGSSHIEGIQRQVVKLSVLKKTVNKEDVVDKSTLVKKLQAFFFRKGMQQKRWVHGHLPQRWPPADGLLGHNYIRSSRWDKL